MHALLFWGEKVFGQYFAKNSGAWDNICYFCSNGICGNWSGIYLFNNTEKKLIAITKADDVFYTVCLCL